MKNLSSLLCLLFIFSIGLSAQEDKFIINGRVVDKITKEPIPHAHIGIPEKGIGTTSGHDGRFRFKVPRQYANSDMVVSYMGYKTFRQSMNTITIPFRVKLVRSQNKLNEIVVTDGNQAEDIIRKAIRAIPKNYSSHAIRNLAFYRESCTDDSLRHRYLAEGVLNVYKRSYNPGKEGQVSLVQGRRMNLKNPLDTIIRGGLGSGHMAAHRFDVVHNREDFINERYLPVYKYWIERATTYNDRLVYVIGFGRDENAKEQAKADKKKNKKNGLMGLVNTFRKRKKREVSEPAKARLEGVVYVDMESYAIIRTEFEVTKDGLRKSHDYPLYSGNWRMNKYVVNYRQIGEKWYFSDALREGNLRGSLYSNEIVITEINTKKGKPLAYQGRMRKSEEFTDMTGTYDPDFWASYNTSPLSAGLAESVMQLENALKAQEVFKPQNMLVLQQKRDSIRYEEEVKRIAEFDISIEEKDSMRSEFDFSEPNYLVKRKRNKISNPVKFHLGLGAHLMNSQADNLSIAYANDEDETIFSLEDDMPQRRFEVVNHFDIDIYFKRNYFVRMGMAWDYLNSIYKDRSIGVGGEWNLSKQRPFFLKAIAQYDMLKYARKVGVADNDYGKFKANGKKFNSKSLNLYYGSRTHNVKLSAEIAVELMPDREFYIRGTYFLPFAQRNDIWIKERKQLFKKKKFVPVRDDEVQVTQNGLPFKSDIPNGGTWLIAVGFVFK